MKLPTITMARSARADQAEVAFAARYLDFQYCFVEFLVDHMGDLSRVFGGDLQQMLILAVVGQTRIRSVRDAIDAGAEPAQAARAPSGISASRLSDITAVPRQTVRRKLALLRDKGWVEQYPDGSWGIAAGDGSATVRQHLAEVDLRAMRRVARLFADLEKIAVPPTEGCSD